MATFFGKILGGLGIGKNAQPSFNANPVGILQPAKTIGITQTTADKVGVLGDTPIEKNGATFTDILGTVGTLSTLATNVINANKKQESDIYGGMLPEVVVKDSPLSNATQKITDIVTGKKPALTFGQEFTMSNDLKIPLYLGIGLLAYKVFFKGGR